MSNPSPTTRISYAETLTEVIMTEAANLYEKMVKDFTNEAMAYAVCG